MTFPVTHACQLPKKFSPGPCLPSPAKYILKSQTPRAHTAEVHAFKGSQTQQTKTRDVVKFQFYVNKQIIIWSKYVSDGLLAVRFHF